MRSRKPGSYEDALSQAETMTEVETINTFKNYLYIAHPVSFYKIGEQFRYSIILVKKTDKSIIPKEGVVS